MFPSKLASKRTVMGCLFLAVVCLGLSQQLQSQRLFGQAREGGRGDVGGEVRGTFKSADAAAGTITVTMFEGRDREAPPVEKTYTLAKNVEVVAVVGGLSRAGVFKEAKLADLAAGTQVHLSFTADKKTVDCVAAEGPTVRGTVKAVDAKKHTLTVSTTVAQRERDQPPAAEDRTYAVAADADISVDDGRGRRFSIKEGRLDDLAENALVTVQLSLDKKQAVSIQAQGATFTGIIKNLDAARKSVTLLTRAPSGRENDNGEEKTLAVAAEAILLLDDGKGRRLSLKEVKLADIPSGTSATVKMSADQLFVMSLRAEGATVTGVFKGADADKGLIVIAIPKGRDEADDKTFNLAKDARVLIDGAEAPLANLKAVDNGPTIQLRLSLDQKTVQTVSAHQGRPR